MLRQLSANTTPYLRQYYIIKYIMYIFNLSIKSLIDKIMVKKSQSNAISTPIECQLNATQIVDSSSQKERLARSKLCRDIYLLDKKNLPWSKSSDKLALRHGG